MSVHTSGPWRWEFNAKHRSLTLVGGRPKYDLTVMCFERWGMNGATMGLRDTAHDDLQMMYRVHERPDWIVPEPGREHHKSWHQLLIHPDANLIAAAPELLEALKSICIWMEGQARAQSKGAHPTFDLMMLREQREIASAAIAKAERGAN